MARSPDEALAKASAHHAAGDHAQARPLYDEVLAADPNHPMALLRVAEQELAQGRADDAAGRIERALNAAMGRGQSTRDLWFVLGRAHMARGDWQAAERAFTGMLDASPGDGAALLSLGWAALATGDPIRAESPLREAVVRHPGFAPAWANLAVALAAQQRLDEAFACARTAVERAPESIASCQVFAAVAIQSGNSEAALPVCRAALARSPGNPLLVAALADVLKATGARREALALLVPLVADPRAPAEVLVSYGALCVESGQFPEAIEYLERAVASGLPNPRAWDNLGTAYAMTEQVERAAAAFAHATELDPKLSPALCHLAEALRKLCDWDGLERVDAVWLDRFDRPDSDPRWNPFIAIFLPTSPGQQLRAAGLWSRHTLPAVAARVPAFVRRPGSRLRIGYLSSDLHDHATAHLAAGLFERHDRSTTEICAYSYGIADASAMRARLVRGFDRWVDLADVSDDAAANRIRDDGIDVLVELKGHTVGNRLGIVCRRPAPIQLHYLGFPGTLGLDAISHLVADAVVIPAGEEAAYHETLLRMPHCYQVNDDRRALPAVSARSALGLPDEAIVLACFNQTTKLSRAFFHLWVQAMREVPRSVLWLYVPHEITQRNLRREAKREGLDPARIVFAPKAANEAHIARLRTADLALDLLPYGSHTTGSDALWAGVPLLSCRGATFAGRVGASLLAAVGLPELVTETKEDYGAELLRLLRDPERLRGYKHYLDIERGRLPLFDTEGFTRAWERMLIRLADGS
jgi:predicted O-linked N-acetylglucosamine transferase (SPINDLY family)